MSQPTKEAEFKQRFAAVIRDLHEAGGEDGEAMAILGSMAGELALANKKPSWSAFKQGLTNDTYRQLIAAFTEKGNEHHQAGRHKQAYAIQALAMSVVAMTQRADADVAAGEKLLDQAIDHTAKTYIALRAKQN
ncbi:hypothetical protein IC608_01445 [Devosia sp. PTR5]|uniref:Uncharacterized protein n=1 Tax=Devosia oryzisoli TaxID=2774138 RepID=A0A927IRW7_9HYPH|nr:hypothetical protein [Devosia oryzisoli]MBD8064141.1 hypothetical protein [Devosia oryzisoli]